MCFAIVISFCCTIAATHNVFTNVSRRLVAFFFIRKYLQALLAA
jgi:hypothetical protein